MSEEKNLELMDYRLQKVEESILAFRRIADTVQKWDTAVGDGGILQLPLQAEKIKQIEARVARLEIISEEITKFKWKAVGVLSVIVFLINLLGVFILQRLHP